MRRNSKQMREYFTGTFTNSFKVKKDSADMDKLTNRTWESPVDYQENTDQHKKWTNNVKYQLKDRVPSASSYDSDSNSKTLKKLLSRFAERTSMQGVSYINTSTCLYTKLIWTALFLSALGGMVFHLCVLCNIYMQFAKQTKVQLGFSNITFPSVTLCNINPVRDSQLTLASPHLQKFVSEIKPDAIALSLELKRPRPPPPPPLAPDSQDQLQENQPVRNQPRPTQTTVDQTQTNEPKVNPPQANQPRGDQTQEKGDQTQANPPKEDQTQANPPKEDQTQENQPKEDQTPANQLKEDQTQANQHKEDQTQANQHKEDQTQANQHKEDQTQANQHKEDQTQENQPKEDQTQANQHKEDQTQANQHKEDQTQANQHKEDQTPANQHKEDQTQANQHKEDQTQANQHKEDQTQANQHKEDQTQTNQPQVDQSRVNQTQSGNLPPRRPPRPNERNKRFIEDLDFNFTHTRQEYDDNGSKPKRHEGRKSNIRGIRKEFRYLFSTHDRETRIAMGHNLSDILVSCTFGGVVCDESNFNLHPTSSYGNCYTLENSDFISYKSGPGDGLELILFLETDEYIPTIASGNGAQVQIHETNTWPDPEVEGMAISAAMETNIAMRMMQISRLGRPYGDCEQGDAFRARYGRKYTRQTCQFFCIQERITSVCGCYDPQKYEIQNRMRRHGESQVKLPCRTKEEVECGMSVEREWETGVFSCPCHNPCYEISYQIATNSRIWPSDGYAKMLVQYLCNIKNDTECDRYKAMTANKLSQNFIKLNIYFDDLNYEKITEAPFYENVQFLSDIGGSIGLWVGLSILSIAEVVQFFAEIGHFLLCVSTNRKKTTAHRIHVTSRVGEYEMDSSSDLTKLPTPHGLAKMQKDQYFR